MDYKKEIKINWVALAIENDNTLTVSVLKHRLRYLDSAIEELEESIEWAVDSLAEAEMQAEMQSYEYEMYCINKVLQGYKENEI